MCSIPPQLALSISSPATVEFSLLEVSFRGSHLPGTITGLRCPAGPTSIYSYAYAPLVEVLLALQALLFTTLFRQVASHCAGRWRVRIGPAILTCKERFGTVKILASRSDNRSRSPARLSMHT